MSKKENDRNPAYSEEYLKAAHSHTIFHRSEILRSATCTCFYCGYRFNPRACAQSLEWTDTRNRHGNEPTLLCPRCGIDCVIGDTSGYPVSDPAFIAEFTRYWFNGYSRIDCGQSPEKITWKPVFVK